jgi:hypothetical protein
MGLQRLPRRLSDVSRSLGKRKPRAGKASFEPARPMSIECANAGLQTRKRMEHGGKGLNVGGLPVYVLVGVGI